MAEGKQTDVSNEPSLAMKVVLTTVRNKFRNVRQVSTGTLGNWLGNSGGGKSEETSANTTERTNIVLLDTRPEEEYVVSHLPNSVRVDPDLNDIGSLIQTIPSLNTSLTGGSRPGCVTVVCYCSLGYRSCVMAQKVQEYFKTSQVTGEGAAVNVYNLEGSLFKWANEGRPMVDRDNKPTVYAHPFSVVFGRLLHKHLRRDTPS